MPEWIDEVALALAAGLGVGLLYFLGLWFTVRRLPTSPNPGRAVLASYVVRLMLAISVFYRVSQGQWRLLAACLVGFVVMRMLLIRKIGMVLSAAGHVRESADR